MPEDHRRVSKCRAFLFLELLNLEGDYNLAMKFRYMAGRLGGASPNKATGERVLTSSPGMPLCVSSLGVLVPPVSHLVV